VRSGDLGVQGISAESSLDVRPIQRWGKVVLRWRWPSKWKWGGVRNSCNMKLSLSCATYWFFRTPGKGFSYAVHSLRRWPWPGCSFCGTQTARFLEFPIPLSYCFVRRRFCMIFGSKTTLHCYKWLGFGALQHTTQEEKLIIYSFHWHALIPYGRVCLRATDLRNPGGTDETRHMLRVRVSVTINCGDLDLMITGLFYNLHSSLVHFTSHTSKSLSLWDTN
jgi:hypothetical protein